MSKLLIADKLSLPADAVTRTLVVYGGKGKGKTNFGAVLCEELASARLRFCVTDPLDVWWGLQHGAKRGTSGIDVVIFGGPHGDMQIEPTAGQVIADFVADEDASTVIVMRHSTGKPWSNGERIRFMRDFVRRLFERQGEQRRPLHLVIDEAGRFVPQQMPKGSVDIADCVGAIEELVEWGRNYGIGCTLITQRSARMNKSVSELAECMVAFQTAGPNSIAAIVDWFGEHIERDRQKELVASLRKLPVGTALVVSPEWLDFEGPAQIRLRTTFDSSATPKAGRSLRAPGEARKPNLDKWRQRMAAVEENAKANDPAELRKQIAELRRELAKKPAAIVAVDQKSAEKLAATAAERDHWHSETVKMERLSKRAIATLQKINALSTLNGELAVKVESPPKIVGTATPKIVKSPQAPAPRKVAMSESGDLPKGEAKILAALIQFPDGLDRSQLTVLTAYKRSSRDAYLQRLREKGYVETAGDAVTATADGIAALPDAEPLPTGEALQNYWRAKLPAGEQAILDVLIGCHPEWVSRDVLTEQTDYRRSSRDAYLQRLKAKQLVELRAGEVRASDTLF